MATITIEAPVLVGFGESVDTTLVEVDTTGTAFAFNDIVVISSGKADKLTAATSGTSVIALAAEPSEDGYYEPVAGSGGSFGSQETEKQVILLGGAELAMSTGNEALAQADIGGVFALGYDSTTGNAFVDLSASSTSGFRITRIADEVYGGVIGDTGTRVVGTITDDICL